MQVFLELSGHPKANVQRVVLGRTTVVGRSTGCGLQVASGSVSRKHCEIRVHDAGVSVVDLGSSNGTFIDNERLPAGEARPLTSGSRLNIGGVRFAVTFAAPFAEPARNGSGVVTPAAATAPTARATPEDEIILEDDVIFVDEPILSPDEPSWGSTAGGGTAEIPAAGGDPDFDDLFAEPPRSDAAEPRVEGEAVVGDADDEPILGSDEDDAFAFLTDDEPVGRESPPEDSKLGAR